MLTVSWHGSIGLYSTWLSAGGASTGTIRLYRHYLRALATTYPDVSPFRVTAEQLALFIATPTWSPETRKSARGAVRGFYSWAVRLEHMPKDPSQHLRAGSIPRALPRPTPQTVLQAALEVAPAREVTMLLLASQAGLRRGEIARVHTRDITADLTGYNLRIVGKGGRVRTVPLLRELALRLLEVRDALYGGRDGWVFPGKINGHLSADRVGVLLASYLGKGWTGHTLRHRFASRAYAVDRDLRAVQELLGHSKPETTARYTAVPDDALRRAVLGSVA